jgi:hypothetical protein
LAANKGYGRGMEGDLINKLDLEDFECGKWLKNGQLDLGTILFIMKKIQFEQMCENKYSNLWKMRNYKENDWGVDKMEGMLGHKKLGIIGGMFIWLIQMGIIVLLFVLFSCCFGALSTVTLTKRGVVPPGFSPFSCWPIACWILMDAGRRFEKVQGRGLASAVQSKNRTQPTTTTATIRKMRDHWKRREINIY